MIPVPVRCVVDASVGIKLVVPEPNSAAAHALFDHLTRDPAAVIAVPDLYYLECGNILWKLARKKQCSAADADRRLAVIRGFRLRRVADFILAEDALRIASQFDISEYDACYVCVSVREKAPLVTADDRLVRKLSGGPYSVVSLSGLTVPPPPP
jgi:predicted nucleic acid-binding protein